MCTKTKYIVCPCLSVRTYVCIPVIFGTLTKSHKKLPHHASLIFELLRMRYNIFFFAAALYSAGQQDLDISLSQTAVSYTILYTPTQDVGGVA